MNKVLLGGLIRYVKCLSENRIEDGLLSNMKFLSDLGGNRFGV